MAAEDTVAEAVDPLIDTVDSTVVSNILHPNAMTELGFCLLVLVIIISVHGWCIGSISRRFAVRMSRLNAASPPWHISLIVSATIALLAVVHLFETLIWTLPIWYLGLIPGFRDSYLYVLEAYTTLGEGSLALPDDWRLVGPMIAISGLFTFSWTGSVLVYVMSESSRRHVRHTHQATQPAEAHPRADVPPPTPGAPPA